MTDCSDCLIYEKLGDDVLAVNQNQAYLCYEHAEFLCMDLSYKQRLKEKKERLLKEYHIKVRRTSIVIISYNCASLMQQCIESIRKYCNSEAYQIVVVDNASTDGVREWLQQQSDIKLILCNENAGFPLGCNIGMQYAEQENDIFFLNNDTRMTPSALFWLRMGLYQKDDIGGVGAVSNHCGNGQQKDIYFEHAEEYVRYGEQINIPCSHPYEEKNRLCGFAMLIRRSVLEEVGEMDVNLSPGYFDDDDFTVRIGMAGYQLIVCHNAFIYHAGSQSFAGRNDLEAVITKNYYYMFEKWQFDIMANAELNEEAIRQIKEASVKPIKVLEVGSGSGNTLTRIKYLYPQSEVYGIEKEERAVRYGVKSVPVITGEWKKMVIPFQKGYFDYIILTRVQEDERIELTEFFRQYLKENGRFL